MDSQPVTQAYQPQQPIRIYADGACLPKNPGGYATYGWLALDAADVVLQAGVGCVAKGRMATNNIAEFGGVLGALTWAVATGLRGVTIWTDSMLVTMLVRGSWRCHKTHLAPLVLEAQRSMSRVHGKIKWLPREQNTRADALSRLAYDQAVADDDWTMDSVLVLPSEASHA
jgi:ribonuclease HI